MDAAAVELEDELVEIALERFPSQAGFFLGRFAVGAWMRGPWL